MNENLNSVASHRDEAVAGTLGLGDLLGLIQGYDDGGLAHDTTDALAKSDVGAADRIVTRLLV